MSTPGSMIRRATIEDVSKLIELWKQEGLPSDALAKRFGEFQVVEQPDGALIGAVGLQIAGQEARVHSEAFARPEVSDAVRATAWERMMVIAKNHGLVRVWTQLNAPFWHLNGFLAPHAEIAAKLPAAFAGDPRPWSFLQLRDEIASTVSVDKEFAMFKEAEHERTERLFRQARLLKLIAALVVMLVFVLIVVWGWAWWKTQGVRR